MKLGRRIYLFYTDHNLSMINYTARILATIAVTLSLFNSLYLLPNPAIIINKVMAQTTSTNNASKTLPYSNMISGNPVFIETDRSTPPKPVLVNGTHGSQVYYSGSGVIEGVRFSAVGTVLIMPRSDNALDLNGHAVITTKNGEKGTYNFYSLGYTGADGTTKDNGTATLHTTSGGNLGALNNLLLVLEDKIDKAGNGLAKGWEWK